MSKMKLIGWLLIGSAVLLAIAGGWYWLGMSEYTVYADDRILSIRGRFENVEDVLAAAGVEVRPQDIVIPEVSTKRDPDGAIQVERAKAVKIHSDDGSELIWTHQGSLSAFLDEAEVTIDPSYSIIADGKQLMYEGIFTAPLPREITVSRFKTVYIVDDGLEEALTTGSRTVGEALEETGITLLNADVVEPELETWLSPELRIQITRASPVIISVDGRYIGQRTNLTRTIDILAEAGVSIGPLDYSVPDADFEVVPGNIIRVVRVTEDFRFEDEAIPFDTLWQGTDRLELDRRAVIVPGEAGILRRRIRVRYEDGVEASQTPDGEFLEKAAVDEIIGYGTDIIVRILETPEGSYEYWRVVRMRVTAYTASSSGKPPEHPAYGITASGVTAGTGVVAVDPSVVPFRSWVYVPGYGIGFAGDTGGGIKGRWIDLGYDEEELVAWSTYTDVYYLTPVPPAEDIAYLIPTALP